MSFRFPLTLAMLLVLLMTLAPAAVDAQIRQATVEVQGLACPFCAYGLEKRLREVGGTGAVEVELKAGQATLEAEEGSSIDLPAVTEAVRKAGFTPGRVEAKAEGTIRLDPDADGSEGYVLEAPDGEPLLLLVNLSAQQGDQVEALSGGGHRVSVSGEVHFHTEALPGLTPEAIQPLQ